MDQRNNENVQTSGTRLRSPRIVLSIFPGVEVLGKVGGEGLPGTLNKVLSFEQKSLIPPLLTYSLGTYSARETSVHISYLSPAFPLRHIHRPSHTHFHLQNKNSCCTDSQLPPVTCPQCQLPLQAARELPQRRRPLLRNT